MNGRTERIPDLEFAILGDGIFRLEQSAGAGETAIVDLHPAQMRLLAERAGLLPPAPRPTWPRGFTRRLYRLERRFCDLANEVLDDKHVDNDTALRISGIHDELEDLMVDFEFLVDDHDQPPYPEQHPEPAALVAPPPQPAQSALELEVTE